jgi:hypothetical protein
METSMSELSEERAHLRKANLDLVEGQARIERQQELTVQFGDAGGDAGRATALLTTFRDTQQAWLQHRNLIEQRIAYLESRDKADAKAPGKLS